jgi:hypothetical protein
MAMKRAEMKDAMTVGKMDLTAEMMAVVKDKMLAVLLVVKKAGMMVG